MNEPDFIAALKALATHPAARGLEDDAAVLPFGNDTIVLTHDSIVQGIHVRDDEDPADIAWKLVAVNLSDLAAKGAEPVGVLVGHTLGEGDDGFVEGLRDVLETFDVPLLGGDTVSGVATRTWGCTAIGRATHVPVPDRRGAKPGEGIFVSGELGRAMLGIEERNSGSANDLAYRRPTPLLAEGRALAPHVSAMMDVSDGLLLDCWRMAAASKVAFDLQSARFPVADPSRREACVRWGDDYQLLFCAPSDANLPLPATRIGTVLPGDGATLRIDGEPASESEGLGYRHRG